jgi:hypothetical protein
VTAAATARGALLGSVALLLAGCAGAGDQRNAEQAAASFADTSLLGSLQEALPGAGPDGRLAAVVQRLRTPDETFMILNGDASWVVGPVRDSTIGITVYYFWEDKSFSASQAWGVVCREYTVSDTVTVTAVECPDGTPRSPGSGAVGWDYRGT